jgi:hypothetical protein
MEDFLRSIQERGVPRTSGEAGLRVVKVLEAAQRSLENRGEPVELLWTDEPARRPTRVQV